ncbi:MAG: hypothetical protein AB1411_15925 [Nitrospirota bacterium]
MTKSATLPVTATWTIPARQLAEALDRLAPVTADHYQNDEVVELAIEPGSLRLRAANQATEIRVTLPCETAARTVLMMPARKLRETVRMLSGDLAMTQKDNVVTMQVGSFKTTLYTASTSVTAKAPVAEGPPQNQVILSAIRLGTLLEQASSCVNQHDRTRPMMQGVLVEVERDRLRLVGTDGCRLVTVWEPVDPLGTWTLPPRTAIIPAIAVRALIGMLAAASKDRTEGDAAAWATMTFRQDGMDLTVGSWHLRTDYQPGPYPNWKAVVPANPAAQPHTNSLRVGREEAIAAVQRIALLASPSYPSMDCQLTKGALTVSTQSDIGQAEETMQAEYDGEPHTVCLNPHFLLEALEILRAEQVEWSQVVNQPAPVVLTGHEDRTICIIMPIKK